MTARLGPVGPAVPTTCQLSDTAKVTTGELVTGRRVTVLRAQRCRRPPTFELITSCTVDGNEASKPTFVCTEHELVMRTHPEAVFCPRGHRSAVIGSLPLGGVQ